MKFNLVAISILISVVSSAHAQLQIPKSNVGCSNKNKKDAPRCDVTTAKGASFHYTVMAGGHAGYEDPDGNVWSMYQGEATNSPVNNIYLSPHTNYWEHRHPTDATEMCKAIGAELPTMLEYRRLKEFFLTVEDSGYYRIGEILTVDGKNELKKVFPDMIRSGPLQTKAGFREFWTTTNRNISQGVFRSGAFRPNKGLDEPTNSASDKLVDFLDRNLNKSIRCIWRAAKNSCNE